MKADENKKEFEQQIMKLLKRLEINQIVFCAELVDNNLKTKKAVDEYLTQNLKKITVNTAFCFNDVDQLEIPSQEKENEGIQTLFNIAVKNINDKIEQLIQREANLYEISDWIKGAIEKIDLQIGGMKYNKWLEEKNAFFSENLYFLVIEGIRYPYTLPQLEITFTRGLIESEFAQRKRVLYELKYQLIDIYSKYLILPDIEKIPIIEFTCKPIDICTLIEAVTTSEYFKQKEKLKAILVELFKITPETYKDKKYIIKNKQESRAGFLRILAENFDRYKY